MQRKIFVLLGSIVLMLLVSSTALAGAVPASFESSPQMNAPQVLNTTFKINVVFVGYSAGDINLPAFQSQLPTTYDPIVRYPAFYGINLPVNIHGDYAFDYTFTPTSFNDAFFSYLTSIGKSKALTDYQAAYNDQVNKTLTVGPKSLYIDAPSTERWLMTHGRDDLGLDIANYTVFFVNWYGRSDFKFHVYTKTDVADPDTGYNFGKVRQTRKIIAWGGSYGRTWFYDLSAGPEAWTDNWNVDDADLDGNGVMEYRMPPVWEYGNTSGYRPFTDLSGDLGKVLRWVAIDLLFTSSPLYDPLASAPFPGKKKKVFVNMFEDDPSANGTNWIDMQLVRDNLSQFQRDYKWKVVLKDQQLTGGAKKAFRIFTGLNGSNDCWNAYGDPFAELFCYFDANRNQYLPKIKPSGPYVGGIFAFNTTDNNLGNQFGLLGFADDNWVSGNPSYVFEFDSPGYRDLGYGFTTTTIHEFGHHIGMSHPHDGYDSTSATDFGPSDDLYFAWSGDESHTIMHYLDLADDFGWFDNDNMNRFLTGRYLTRANEIAAQMQSGETSREANALLEQAESRAIEARAAFQKMDYARAASEAKASFDQVWRAAKLAGLKVPMIEPLPQGGPRQGPKMVDPIRFPDN